MKKYKKIIWKHKKSNYIEINEERNLIPQTKVKNPELKEKDDNWVIWAAWVDRITFEEIRKLEKQSLKS